MFFQVPSRQTYLNYLLENLTEQVFFLQAVLLCEITGVGGVGGAGASCIIVEGGRRWE